MIEIDLTEHTPTIGYNADCWRILLVTGSSPEHANDCVLHLDGSEPRTIRHKGRAGLRSTGSTPYTMFDRDIMDSGRYEVTCQVRSGPPLKMWLDIVLSPERVAVTVLKESTPATWIVQDEVVVLKGNEDYTLVVYEEPVEQVERPAIWDRLGDPDDPV